MSDTQTGLRAIPAFFMEKLLEVKGERFEYETNMLIEAKNLNIRILEVPVKTCVPLPSSTTITWRMPASCRAVSSVINFSSGS